MNPPTDYRNGPQPPYDFRARKIKPYVNPARRAPAPSWGPLWMTPEQALVTGEFVWNN